MRWQRIYLRDLENNGSLAGIHTYRTWSCASPGDCVTGMLPSRCCSRFHASRDQCQHSHPQRLCARALMNLNLCDGSRGCRASVTQESFSTTVAVLPVPPCLSSYRTRLKGAVCTHLLGHQSWVLNKMQAAFIYEDPEGEEARQKRPRIITSCDACRRRKHRCERTLSSVKCDACITAKISCSTNDRQRYFVERRRVLEQTRDVSAIPPATPTSIPPRSQPSQTNLNTYDTSGSHVLLFEPQRPGEHFLRPHAAIMPTYIQVFFQHMATDYPYLSFEDVMRAHSLQRLSPLLANCIAALAVPFSNLPADLYSIAEGYGHHAKVLLDLILRGMDSSIDIVEALIMIAWFEYRSGRHDGLSLYYQLAIEMAVQLGLCDEPQYAGSPPQTNPAYLVWAAILSLNHAMSQIRVVNPYT